jgi:hypothetical protein
VHREYRSVANMHLIQIMHCGCILLCRTDNAVETCCTLVLLQLSVTLLSEDCNRTGADVATSLEVCRIPSRRTADGPYSSPVPKSIRELTVNTSVRDADILRLVASG